MKNYSNLNWNPHDWEFHVSAKDFPTQILQLVQVQPGLIVICGDYNVYMRKTYIKRTQNVQLFIRK